MNKKIIFSILLAVMLAVFTLSPAAAANGQPPAGTCATGFERHMVMDHMEDHPHEQHIGITVDLNKNGYLCVKHLSSDYHVHADDVLLKP